MRHVPIIMRPTALRSVLRVVAAATATHTPKFRAESWFSIILTITKVLNARISANTASMQGFSAFSNSATKLAADMLGLVAAVCVIERAIETKRPSCHACYRICGLQRLHFVIQR